MTTARRAPRPRPSRLGSGLAGLRAEGVARDPHAPLARGCKPRGCRAPARRVLGRRVRYILGSEPGQVNGMRWRAGAAL
ncbi:tryptophan biosynthesis modulator TrpM [Streptomyces sp. NPDC101118]|uniref:tryptophan biosynthesis modulator TrpM n=1 Tax=unclassified Streptomyces TaxID=2593676 RepID=UPI0037D4EF9E